MRSADPGGDAPVLEMRDVTVAYDGVVALDKLTFTARPGDAIALIGPNGAGKSTLLRAILGLVPLSAGEITIFGRPPSEVRTEVAYVPQADTLDAEFPVSVLQVVLMGRYRSIGIGRRPSRADRDAARNALAEVGLAVRGEDRFGTLSGGQRQRVLLARAVAQGARLLLLDEPFNGLDAPTTDVLVGVLSRLRAEGVAVVLSTHDLTVAHLTCDEACLLNRHQVARGPINETLTPDLLTETYGSRAAVLAGGATVIET
jgi:manganese/iron transport system ATP-binding protein